MDSLTQIVLGAGVGEATLGHKIGNRAMLWGGIAGTIPDLDVLFTDFYDTVDGLFVHRGFSHSILFSLLLAPILGYLAYRIHRNQPVSWKMWGLMMFLAFFTHILLDTLTSYGTGLFEPFSNVRPELSTIAIVDVFYTLPFLIFLIVLAFFNRISSIRRKLIIWALVVSTSYLGFTALNRLYVKNQFEKALAGKGIDYDKLKLQPLPLTNFLWMAIADSDSGYYIGYYSNFDEGRVDQFEYIADNKSVPEEIKDHAMIQGLIRFSKGYYHMEPHSGGWYFHDLRFGKMGFNESASYIFSFNIKQTPDGVEVSEAEFSGDFSSEDFKQYIARIKGEKDTSVI
ncbi:MAG: metal-dependent hydrolase [Bacteroidota bacterium]